MSTGEQAAEVPRKNEDVTSLTAVSSVFTVASEAGLVSSKLEPTTSPGLDATEKATQVTSATVCVGGVSSHRQTSDGSNNDTPTTTPASSTTFNGEVNNNVFHQKKRNFKYKNNNNDRKTSDINENNTLKINKNNNDNNSSNNNKNKNNNSSNNNDNNDSLNNDNSSTDDSTCNKEEVDSIKRVDSGENEETGLFFNPIKAQAMVLMNAYDKGGVSTSTMGDLESCDFDSVRGITSTEKQFFQLRQKQLIDYQTKNNQEIQKFKSRQKQQFYPATSQSNYKLLTTKHPAACYQAANKQHSKPQNNSQMKPKYLQKYESPLENNINPANGTDFQKKHYPLYNNINNNNINNNNINNNNINNNNNISNSNINNNNINNNTSDININNNYTNTNNINDNNTNINENNDNITNNDNDKNNKDNNNNNDNKNNNNNDPDKDNRIFLQQQQSEPHNHCKPYIAFDGSDGDLDDRQYSFLNYANFEMLKQENDWLKKELKEWKEKYECLLQMGDTKNSRIYKLQAETYKDDFHQERADREAAMGKLEEVEKKLKLAEETLSLYCMVYDMA